jgi:16S rRNA (cytidine1402-2'-O)-methyltransferase
MGAGKLILVGTPLGNREDLSARARRTLLEADLLLCEDTRSPQRLLPDVELPERVSCFVGNEHERVAMLLERLAAGQVVAFVSEAGLPVWSDPGRLLVAAAVEGGYEVDVIPGPTAGTCALALSGFPAEGACFFGFLARGGKDRDAELERLASAHGPAIVYEAGNRTPALLRDLAAKLGDRRALIARELTKLHQELLRGTITELAARVTEPLRGEVTVVIEGPTATTAPKEDPAEQAARAVLDVMLDASLKPRARAKALAELTGLDARELYDRLRGGSERDNEI